MDDLLIRSRRTVLPDGERPAAVSVRGGRIAAIAAYDAAAPAAESVDLGDVALLPGLVDTHVHVNEPGRTEWEGFATATRAAAAGGVTTLVDMPLNALPPTVDPAALAAKRAAAEGACAVDVGFWGGAIPGNLASLRPLHDLGVFGFKCFTSDSGVPEFPPLAPGEMRAAFREIASFGGLVIVHAEDPASLRPPAGGDYPAFLASRPPFAERRAVEQVVGLAEETGVRAHILHLSSASCLEVLAKAQTAGLPVTAETCPHYLTLSADDAYATTFKCCPPIRDEANRDLLWQGLASGVISCVVSDHSPCTPELKLGDFATAWGGVSSLQLGLPAVWTAARERGHGLASVARWTSEAPAALAAVPGKGGIAVGNDADLVAFAPDETFTVDPAALHHRHPVTPYAGRTLTGLVRTTWLRGVPIADEPAGRLLTREAR
ncbi:allantoinase AllB [Actinomadura madurae]|uniref:allantoinase AllB n=1 Tax=Actinomadura madurae TaxID=1993 RepID=UPI002026B8AF|nr:allantoinase AllB [Actinomadura madurae]MCP9970955.1 allantoinase AllB [Actinomadura madurae]MCP9983433.1 allantoinase AllB [Actinomadura madurae]URM99697.1 allantoinase AllB [Actinomadura madurae]URN10360.1 allantoinase AllB [Actinomadura madurae]